MRGDKLLSVKNIVKTYPGVIAINNFSMDVMEGEVHALIGENGAGKSTLIKTLSGAITPDSGTIEINGKTFESMTPALSKKQGIEVIYQEFTLVPGISAAENVYLGEKTSDGIFVDIKDREKKAAELEVSQLRIEKTELSGKIERINSLFPVKAYRRAMRLFKPICFKIKKVVSIWIR